VTTKGGKLVTSGSYGREGLLQEGAFRKPWKKEIRKLEANGREY
jgi:hypothetical protein